MKLEILGSFGLLFVATLVQAVAIIIVAATRAGPTKITDSFSWPARAKAAFLWKMIGGWPLLLLVNFLITLWVLNRLWDIAGTM